MKIIFVITTFLFFLSSCSYDTSTKLRCIRCKKRTNISGVIQKGPFKKGSSVTIYELSRDLDLTDRSHHKFVADNGEYTFPTNIKSEFVEIVASGFYTSENTNKVSNAPILLRAIVNVRDKSQVNLNVLTTISTSRIKKLKMLGNSFKLAKDQTTREIQSIFEKDVDNFDQLDIRTNSHLLSVSSLLQRLGDEDANKVTFLIGTISDELEAYGKISDATKALLNPIEEEPIEEEPIEEEPIEEEPIEEEPIEEEPIEEEPIVEEPIVEEPIVEEPIVSLLLDLNLLIVSN